MLLLIAGDTAADSPKPLVGVYVSEADIANAHRNIQRYDWAKREWDHIKGIADAWLEREDQWIRDMVPAKGSTFSYGTTGCPACGAAWPHFGGGMCSWDRPGRLTCPKCKREFPDPDPGSPYHDTGKGITVDGRRYYLQGVWNSWVVEQLCTAWNNENSAVRNLSLAYTLTGDRRYAHKAAIILDALAAVQPTTIGPRDFARSDDSLEGRFNHLSSIVFRTKVLQVDAYDRIGRLEELDEPSPSNPGQTMRENIVRNMLEDYLFLHVDVRDGKLETLHNHEADCVRGMLAVGMVIGNPDYIRWGLDAISYYISNTIDRDGQYYETSAGYSAFGTAVIFDMAHVAANYSPEHYPNPQRFPSPNDYPYKLNFFDSPKLAVACLRAAVDIDCAGHVPGFGNAHGSLAQVTDEQEPPVDPYMADMFLAKSTDPDIRRLAAARLVNSSVDTEGIRRSGVWCMFYAQDLDRRDAPSSLPTGPTLLGGRDLAILRSGSGADRRAALVRDGCTLPHGHDDILSLLLYGKGRDLSYEIGYGIFGTPVHVGWNQRQACHNLVVVDEDVHRPAGQFRKTPGGGVILFGQEGPVSVVEMDGLESRTGEGLSMYRRAVAQVDISAEDAYWVDVFRVVGGGQHDYIFHGSWGQDEENDFGAAGIELSKPEVWTLAGLNPAHRGASFDKPGWSWGERIVPGEFIKDMDDPSEQIGGRGWMPPPGNGYGFLHDVRTATATGPYRAEWRDLVPDDTRLRMVSLPQGETQVITALGPTLDGKHRMHYVIARRSGDAGLESRFVSVFVPYRGDCPVRSVEEVPLSPRDPMAVCVKVTLADGRVDYVLSAPDVDSRSAEIDGKVRIAFQGTYALVRTRDQQAESLHLFSGTRLECGDKSIRLPASSLEAEIVAIDENARTITINAAADGLQGRVALIRSKGSPRRSAYNIAAAKPAADGVVLSLQCLDLVQARGVLDADPVGSAISSRVPVPFGYTIGTPTRYFDGAPIRNTRTGRLSRVRSFADMKRFEIEDPSGWKTGDGFEILDFTLGDHVTIPLSARSAD